MKNGKYIILRKITDLEKMIDLVNKNGFIISKSIYYRILKIFNKKHTTNIKNFDNSFNIVSTQGLNNEEFLRYRLNYELNEKIIIIRNNMDVYFIRKYKFKDCYSDWDEYEHIKIKQYYRKKKIKNILK